MAENLLTTFKISGSGMSVQRMRLSAAAKNIANANTTKGPDGLPYRRDVVIVSAGESSSFDSELNGQLRLAGTGSAHIANASDSYSGDTGMAINAITGKDNSPPRLIYDPSHPEADEEGYIRMPDIDIVTEMVEMISAQKAFEANTQIIESAKNIARDSLEI